MLDFKAIAFFENLDEDTLKFISAGSQKKSFRQNETIFYAGDMPSSLLVLADGEVEIYKNDEKGNEIIMGVFRHPALLAEMPTFERSIYPASARAKMDSIVYEIKIDSIIEHIKKSSPLSIIFINSLTKKIKRLEGLLRYATISNANIRVVAYLLDNQDKLEYTTQKQMAATLMLTPEGLSRIIKRFKNDGLVEVHNKKLCIVDRDGLVRIIG